MLTANLDMQVTGTQTGTADLGNVQQQFADRLALALTNGSSGAGKADRVFNDQRTLSASGTEDLDFAGGVTDALGNTVTMAKIKAVFVKAAPGNTNNVNVTRPASNGVPLFLAAGDGISVKPGAGWMLIDDNGITVTASTGDLLTITNSGGTTPVTYDIVVIGTSA